ncbi:hypothetical protein P7K49_023403 [Saguinus oedipus]|uniref:Uncharacterized protein n=1 Tax=Saguinus oedipus TaxID=9490 RepID=A0ABQ9ULI8_SAGOE|nr:hypothetical protein P7K49_023403 [Saguinus oedipus]
MSPSLVPLQLQNRNEELQTVRDLPTRTDLSSCCKKEPCSRGPKPLPQPLPGAQQVQGGSHMGTMVVRGIVMAISPTEETKLQMFIWSHIDLAGDVVASIAFTNDLNGEQLCSAADLEGLYMLDTAEVDDCGFWVRFQSSSLASWSGTRSRVSSVASLTLQDSGVDPVVPETAGAQVNCSRLCDPVCSSTVMRRRSSSR